MGGLMVLPAMPTGPREARPDDRLRIVRRRADALLTMRNGSSHLALHLGGVFRIDFADHTVTAVALGGIEAGVGALDQ